MLGENGRMIQSKRSKRILSGHRMRTPCFFRTAERMARDRGATFNWPDIVAELGGEEWIHDPYDQCYTRHTYLGSLLSVAPSGKVYAPWSTNVSALDISADTAWWQMMEDSASDHSLSIETGESDGCDLFAYQAMDYSEWREYQATMVPIDCR